MSCEALDTNTNGTNITISTTDLIKELKIKFDIGSLKKLILFSEDMDFIQNQSTIDTIVKNLNDIFQNHIDKIKITLLSKSWNLNWGNIFTSNNLGCLSMVIDRNIQLGKNYNLLNIVYLFQHQFHYQH